MVIRKFKVTIEMATSNYLNHSLNDVSEMLRVGLEAACTRQTIFQGRHLEEITDDTSEVNQDQI